MTDIQRDDRLQFYLRHYREIREWAAIGRDVMDATRELLGSIRADLDVRFAAEGVITTRDDEGRFERLVLRRTSWPPRIGVALEWESSVDPFGGSLPKYGIIFLNFEPEHEIARATIVARAKQAALYGFKVPGDRVWPAVRWVEKDENWWMDPDTWAAGITDSLTDVWHAAAPVIDEAFAP